MKNKRNGLTMKIKQWINPPWQNLVKLQEQASMYEKSLQSIKKT